MQVVALFLALTSAGENMHPAGTGRGLPGTALLRQDVLVDPAVL